MNSNTDSDARLFIHIPKNGGTYIRALLSDPGHRHEELVARIVTPGPGKWFRPSTKPRCSPRSEPTATCSEPFYSDPSYQFRSFQHFLEDRHVFGGRPHYWLRAIRSWYPQREYVVDDRGAVVCDLLRQETLTDDLAAYFRVVLDRTVVNRTDSDDYRAYYDSQTMQIVADWYADDIHTFGFDFDTGATKNTWATG